jgi:hypothetical protein
MGMFDKIREDLNGEVSKSVVQDTVTFITSEQPETLPAVLPPARPRAFSTPQEPGKCRAHTTGNYGDKRPCRNWAIKGGTVCRYHGGAAPQVKAAAQKRLNELLMPAIERLGELADQNEHLPSALGAVNTILNHTKGKPGENKNKGAKRGPTIIVGIGLGGLPASAIKVEVQQPDEEDYDEGELVDEGNE